MKRNLTKPIYKFLLVLLIAGFGGMSAMGQDLTLIKRVMNDNIDPGDIITFQIMYINNSAYWHTDVVVVDQVPAGDVEYIGSVPAGAIHNTTSNTVTFDKTVVSDFANLTTGSGVLYVSFRVGKLGSDFTGTNHYPTGYYLDSNIQHETLDATIQNVVNQASITSSTQTTASYSNEATATALQICDASITQASPGALKSNTGNMFEYLVTITNTGNVYNKYDLTASIYDPTNNPYNDGSGLPEVTTLNTLNPSLRTVGSTPTNPTPVTTTPWLAPGEMFTFILHLDITNDAQPSLPDRRYRDALTSVKATSILCNKEFDKIFRTGVCGGNDCTPGVSVGTYKYGLPDIVESGGELEYTIVLFNGYTVKVGSNYVGQAVSGISIKDKFPMTYINSIISVGSPISENAGLTYTYNPSDHTWNFSNLPPGTTTIKVRVRLNTNIANNTIIENTLESYYNGNLVNTYIAKNTVISTPDLKIEKSSSQVNVEAGEKYTYTLHYENNGSYFSELTEIYDDFDEGLLEIIEVTDETGITTTIPPGNLYDPVPAEKIYVKDGKIKWEVGRVEIGESGTVSYKVRVKTGNYPAGNTPINNTANILDDATKRDKNLSDNITYHIVNLTSLPDLELTKTVDKEKILAINTADGETLTYTITIKNIGVVDLPATAGGYSVTDILPAGLSYVSDDSNVTPSNNNGNLTWNFLNAALVADGTPHSFNVVVKGVDFSQIGNILRNEASVELNGTLSESDYDNNSDFAETKVYRNLWVGSTDVTTGTKWDLTTNWTYDVPGTNGLNKDVEFATTDNYSKVADNHLVVDDDATNPKDGINDGIKTIDNLINVSDKALIIPTYKTLVIDETATVNNVDRILIKSEVGEANGALIFTHPEYEENQDVLATVEFASKSKPGTGTWPRVWQFFGVPVVNKTLTDLFGTNVQGSIYGGDPATNEIVRKYNEALNLSYSYQEKWEDLDPATHVMRPYEGYEITQPAENTIHSFVGTLVTDASKTLNFTISPTGVYSRGNYILANPYAAPIFISKMLPEDFTNLAQTIYLYNTGSRQDWLTNNGASHLGTQPGTYTSIPILSANTIGIPQIPSMQGFMVKASADVAPTSFKFRYATVNRGTLTYPNEPMRIKRAEAPAADDIKPLLSMDVIGETGSDRVYLITAPGTSKSYDAGWDGFKTLSTDNVQLYAMDADNKRMQVNTDNDLNDTYIGFRTGGESTYTLKFTFNNEMQGVYESLYVQDLATGVTQEITDGMTMTFVTAAGTAEKRFRISGERIITGVNNALTGDDITLKYTSSSIMVNNNSGDDVQVTVFNLVGQPLLTEKISAGVNTFSHNLLKGTYIIEAKSINNSSKTILKAIIN